MKEGAVRSFDLDGVVFKRPLPIQFHTMNNFIRFGTAIYLPPQAVPQVTREIDQTPLQGLREKWSYFWHLDRDLLNGADDLILQTAMDKIAVVGNTGRLNKKAFVDLTEDSLSEHEILNLFRRIYYRPAGISTKYSKIAAIAELAQEYERVEHYDDNPADALPIAAFFPEVKVIIIQDLTTGILFSAQEAKKYPNVRRVASPWHAIRAISQDSMV